MTRKLAIIVYHMLKEGRPYKDQGAAYYEARYRQRLVEGLRRRAHQLGLAVVSVATVPQSVAQVRGRFKFEAGRAGCEEALRRW